MGTETEPLSKWIEACETSPWGRPHSVGCVGHGMGLSLHYYDLDRPLVLLSLSRGSVIDAFIECRDLTFMVITPELLHAKLCELHHGDDLTVTESRRN